MSEATLIQPDYLFSSKILMSATYEVSEIPIARVSVSYEVSIMWVSRDEIY